MEYYTEDEICTFYKNANVHQDRIKLLEELTTLSSKDIIKILKKHGYKVEKRQKKNILSNEEFLRYYNLGINDRQISIKLKISEGVVNRTRRDLGLPPIGGNKPMQKVKMIELHSEGLSNKEIALALDVHYVTIWNWLKDLGMVGNKKPRESKQTSSSKK